MRARRFTPGRVTAASGAALLAALAYVLASPPHDVAWLAWLAPPLLLLPLVGLRARAAIVPGLLFGVAIAAGITTWAVSASLAYFDLDRVAATSFALLVWLVYSGLPYACLTVGFALAAPRVAPAWRPLLAAWGWVAVEVLRTRAPLALPWGLLSHTQWENVRLLQVADLGGAYAVTFVVAYVGVALVLAARALGARAWRSGAGFALPALALLALVLAYGAIEARAPRDGERQRVAVVQGAGRQVERWRRGSVERSLATYARHTAAVGEPVDLVVWPENAVDAYMERDPMLLGRLRQVARSRGTPLLFGAPRLASAGIAHNSVHLLDADGTSRGAYDKQVLVPLAEGSILPVADAVAAEAEPTYRGGAHGAPLETGSFSLGVLVCFEVLFPQLVAATVADGANLLVNVSNDGWLDAGDGAAPRQHLAGAVLRAVETRRALVRASAGGVSGFVDATGGVHDVVPWGEVGPSVGDVALHRVTTPYVRFGDAWIAASGALLALVVLRGRRGSAS